ncbi:uncharacterized protein LOC130731964 [Lotus japonicus]|uniref:uncharacterized protein LOC130731964 n=1 Tax=Lotus japonicus TaxID=34305 RepID=UPI0025846068|nr:uncharacterized protein LOC130731964 [Lotus japonicus]
MAPVWNLQCVQLNELDVECCRYLQQHLIGNYFQMKVRVRREPCFLLHPNMPSTLTAVNPPSIECDIRSFIIESWDDIRENGLSRFESNLSYNHIIPAEFIPSLAQNVIQYANELVQGCPPGFGYGYESPHLTWFKFVLDITVPELIEDQDLIIRNIMWQSVTQMASELGDNQDDIRVPELYHNEDHFMDSELYDMLSELSNSVDYTLTWEPLEMAPTSIAIESLKKVKLEEGAAMESCSICLTELGDGARAVSSTPCKHVFHQDCLVQWLIKSPTCPLCRCAIPTLIDYT